MKQDKKIDADKIHVLAIRTLAGSIDCPPEAEGNPVATHEFSFNLGTGLKTEENLVGLKLIVNIEARDKKDKVLPIKGSYTHEIVFRIDNLGDFIEKEGEEERIDAGLGSTLVSIIYSTVRGIIYSRTQGTSLGVVILPVIAPLKLMGVVPTELSFSEEDSKSDKKTDKSVTKVHKQTKS